MSNTPHSISMSFFVGHAGVSAVVLPFDYSKIIEQWQVVRLEMIRSMPEEFSRDEWAYLLSFLDVSNLTKSFHDCFGSPITDTSTPPERLFRLRGPIAVWLPSNVSLLGPLMIVLLSLSGAQVRLKGGSRSGNLMGVFVDFLTTKLPAGELREWMNSSLSVGYFDRTDPRNREFAEQSSVRIVFGSDEAAREVSLLPHPLHSIEINFTDHQSEAWLSQESLSESILLDLIRVFAVYGQAGCTSPHRVVLLDGTFDDVRSLAFDLSRLWPKVIKGIPADGVASGNILAQQLGLARGWGAVLAPFNSAVFLFSDTYREPVPGTMALHLVGASKLSAERNLPSNVQTLALGVPDKESRQWLDLAARTSVKRIVPLNSMHRFGHVWDGYMFWRSLFEEVPLR